MKNKSILILLLSSLTLFSCTTNNYQVYEYDVNGFFIDDEFVFPMNTLTKVKSYQKDDEMFAIFEDMVKKNSAEVDRYHTYEGINNLKTINDSCGKNEKIKVSNDLFELLSLAIEYTKLSEGKFNLAMGSLIDLYSPYFSSPKDMVYDCFPIEEELLNNVISSIPNYSDIENYIVLDEENKTVLLNKYNDENVVISLGAIAKGFVMQKCYDYLQTLNKPYLIDAGSSTMACINENPLSSNKKWSIAFKDPSINTPEMYLCNVHLNKNVKISTSGDYLQNFSYLKDNIIYKEHHILDFNTGKSNHYLRNASLISYDASLTMLDALSTALFNCNSASSRLELINVFEERYNCHIDYCFVIPKTANGNIDYDTYYLELSSSFASSVVNQYSKNAIEIIINK